MRTLIIALVLLASCAQAHEPAEYEVTMSCLRSFPTTLREWRVWAREPVPEQCEFLDADVDVQLVDTMPPDCGDAPDGQQVSGCYLPGQRAILILSSLDDIARVDVSVHEWLHALAHCVYGEPDQHHARSGLWADSLPAPVETRAQAAAVLGSCL